MDPFESIKQTFFQECDELLTDAEQGLLAMESGDADDETINAVFRAVHSVKGGAGAFGLEDLIRFAHVFETVMDEIRSGKMELTDDVAKTLLRAFDVLADHVAAARDGGKVEEGRSQGAYSELRGLIGGEDEEDDLGGGGDEDFGFVPLTLSIEGDEAPGGFIDLDAQNAEAEAELPVAEAAQGDSLSSWMIEFSPKSEMYAKANEAGLVLRELARLGETRVTLIDEALPPLDQLAAEQAYVSWRIQLFTDSDEASIREVFEFVEDDCNLIITRDGAEPEAAAPQAADDGLSDDDRAAAASATADLDIAALLARVGGGEAPAEPEAAPDIVAETPVEAPAEDVA
ncbi:MAG: Hpt domain-containing protein, partial [Pseudomonadota bacterium]